eukprot:11239954-Karenia_brevis.AAC.1
MSPQARKEATEYGLGAQAVKAVASQAYKDAKAVWDANNGKSCTSTEWSNKLQGKMSGLLEA